MRWGDTGEIALPMRGRMVSIMDEDVMTGNTAHYGILVEVLTRGRVFTHTVAMGVSR